MADDSTVEEPGGREPTRREPPWPKRLVAEVDGKSEEAARGSQA